MFPKYTQILEKLFINYQKYSETFRNIQKYSITFRNIKKYKSFTDPPVKDLN